ncbi:hypothetical protein SEVIR_3G273950v4 [Setaria viridis]
MGIEIGHEIINFVTPCACTGRAHDRDVSSLVRGSPAQTWPVPRGNVRRRRERRAGPRGHRVTCASHRLAPLSLLVSFLSTDAIWEDRCWAPGTTDRARSANQNSCLGRAARRTVRHRGIRTTVKVSMRLGRRVRATRVAVWLIF